MTVGAAHWCLVAMDISNGGGVCTVTTKAGCQFKGTVDQDKLTTFKDSITLHQAGGWHVIDYDDIAAMTGMP